MVRDAEIPNEELWEMGERVEKSDLWTMIRYNIDKMMKRMNASANQITRTDQ